MPVNEEIPEVNEEIPEAGKKQMLDGVPGPASFETLKPGKFGGLTVMLNTRSPCDKRTADPSLCAP